MYLTSYIDGKKGVDTLDGYSDEALDYIEDIYEHYYSITGYDGANGSSSDGSWWGDIEISTEFSVESDSFEAVLSIEYYIYDYYENGSSFNSKDLYALTFDLNEDNKFDITETYSYKKVDGYVDHFDGTSVFFDVWNSHQEDITSLNLKTGQYQNETLLQSNLDFYFGGDEDAYLDELERTDNYGLVTAIRNEREITVIENINTENHSVLFKDESDWGEYSYIEDLTENKYGTLYVLAENSGETTTTFSNDNNIRTTSRYENDKLYSYEKNGSLNVIDLGKYETYYKSEYNNGSYYDKNVENYDTDFFLWNDNDADTWLIKSYEYRNDISGENYEYYEGFVLDDDFSLDNQADLTLRLEIDEELDDSEHFGGQAATNGFHLGFIFSPTEAEYDYEQEQVKNIVNKIHEANSWDEINYKTYDWSKVDYDSLSDYETERIKWTKVDLKLALDSEDFRFDAIDWAEIKKNGGVNTKKVYKLLNNYNFDDDEDTINLKYLTSVKKIKAGGGNDSIEGNSKKNSFYGQDGNDTIKGYSGSDKLYGDDGDDYLDGGTSADKLYGGNGNDELHGGTSKDKLYGGDDNDKLYGDSSADKLYGQDGDDYLEGGSSKDKLYGGNGNDELYGGTDKDFLRGGEDEDTLYGESGNDKLMGEGGKDILYGGTDKDFLRGGGGEDILYGESGNDKLKGEAGNDILVGGLGFDNLYGGSGNDVFKLTEGIGFDRIRDFKKGEDRIDIADFDINELGVFDSGKNIKVYLDKDKSDLLAIIYKNNIEDGSISEYIF